MLDKESTIIVSVFVISLVFPFFNSGDGNPPHPTPPPPKVVINDHYKYAGAFAYGFNNNQKDNQNDEDDEESGCKCGGTEYIIHGDGHKTPCPCKGDESGTCNCKKDNDNGSKPVEKSQNTPQKQPQEKVQSNSQKIVDNEPKISKNVIMIFTATWCNACNVFKANELPKLKKLGLNYSEPRDGKFTEIEIVDIDKFPDIYNEWRKHSVYIPLFVLTDRSGNEHVRVEGYVTADYLYNLWQKYN